MVAKEIVAICVLAVVLQASAASIGADASAADQGGRCIGLVFKCIGMMNAYTGQIERARAQSAQNDAALARCDALPAQEQVEACKAAAQAAGDAQAAALLAGQVALYNKAKISLAGLSECANAAA